jgi:vWA-MoxR associated protein C-terminal domain
VQYAGREGWSELLVVCAIAFHRARPDADEISRLLLSEYGCAAVELAVILANDSLTDSFVRQCYYDSTKDFLAARPAQTDIGKTYAAYSILLAEESAKGASPLKNFLRLIAAKLKGDDRRQLESWWQRTAAQLQIPAASPIVATQVQDVYSLIVVLREADESTREKPKWLPKAWLHKHNTTRHDPIDVDTRLDGETRETIRTYLEKVRRIVVSRVSDPGNVVFEFFVPLTSLMLDIDQWEILVDPLIPPGPLGFENPVLIRYLHFDDEAAKERNVKVRKRWEKLRAARRLTNDVQAHVWFSDSVLVPDDDRGLREMRDKLERKSDLQCLIFPRPIGGTDDIAQHGWLLASIVAGLPIIVWARHADAAAKLSSEALTLFSEPPCLAPWRVHELRRGKSPLARHLSLFFENGDCALPAAAQDSNNPLTGARS